MLRHWLHQFQTHTTRLSSSGFEVDATMRFVSVQIICSLLILLYCGETVQSARTHSKKRLDDQTGLVDGLQPDVDVARLADKSKKRTDNNDDQSEEDNGELDNLPILPPIILIDFTNDSRSDEKTKRTVDGNIGYGFARNDLFSGKYNYYFPAGKTGTTVSIEASISPFEPKTIIERVKPNTENIKPITEKPETEVDDQNNAFVHKNPSTVYRQGYREYSQAYPVFGERTKLFKTNDASFNSGSLQPGSPNTGSSIPGSSSASKSGRNYHTTVRPSYGSYSSSKPSYQSNIYSARIRNPGSYSTARPSNGFGTTTHQTYSTTPLSTYGTNYDDENYGTIDSTLDENTGKEESPYEGLSLSDYPKYTIENGIRYKHKIVWKYPNGKVSDDPPPSYTNSQFQLPQQKLVPVNTYQTTDYEARPLSQQSSQGTSYDDGVNSNVYSHGPLQFPNIGKSINQKVPSRFVSSASLSSGSSKSAPISESQTYPVRYQNQYVQTQAAKSSPQDPTLFKMSTNNRHSYVPVVTQSPVPKYAIESGNPEYTYSTNGQHQGTSSQDGKLTVNTLNKYSPQVQKYLSKVFSSNPPSKQYDNTNSETAYSTDYSNLLNYNPSISQYVKNPASILNAQPTFIQAGNSLIPVIILRVDGAPPIQSKSSPHINLKALLQQYLHQYANSVSKLTQNSNFELGSGRLENSEAQTENPLNDLRLFTETLSRLSKKPAFVSAFSENYASSSQRMPEYTMRYTSILQNQDKTNNMEIKIPPKVKSVQIIEDPRYMSYKIES